MRNTLTSATSSQAGGYGGDLPSEEFMPSKSRSVHRSSASGLDLRWRSRKPSPVRRVGGWSSIWDGSHLPPLAAYPRFWWSGPDLTAYLALLRLGVAVPRLLPAARWALTPPFHPYPLIGRFVFCGPIRRLSTPRCYLAICPLELGLSSTRQSRAATITLHQPLVRQKDSVSRPLALERWLRGATPRSKLRAPVEALTAG